MLFATSTLLFAGLASAHTTLQYAFIGDTETEGIIREVPSNNPVQDVKSSDMACNVNGDTPAANTAEVAAGSSITVEWHHEGRDSDAVDSSHKGPILTYLAQTDSASSESDPSSLDWFKIAEEGIDGNTWAVDTLIENNGKWEIEIPASIPDGEYLLRNEIIALHSAFTEGEAQFYIGCVQIKITGGGSASPSNTVSFPGAYSADDPGILLQIYNDAGEPYPDSYEIPGPEVFSA